VVAVVDELRFKLEEAWGASLRPIGLSATANLVLRVSTLAQFKATVRWSFFWPRDGGGGRSCRRRRRLASVGLVAKVKHKV